MKKRLKLSNWAKNNDVTYKTAFKWLKEGNLPVEYEYTNSGRIFVFVEEDENNNEYDNNPVYVYGRVSSHNKKDDLERQIRRCEDFCENIGLSVTSSYREVASGMNDNRKLLNKILHKPVGTIIVEHKDRLTRFGFNYIKNLYERMGGKIIVINQEEGEKDDLMNDLISIITSFCCRIYGKRNGKKKSKELKEQLS